MPGAEAAFDDLIAHARTAGEDIDVALQLARVHGRAVPRPGSGATARRWDVLRRVARANVTVARVLEAHTDALAILAEAGEQDAGDRTWGVFAAEAPDQRVDAQVAADGSAVLTGTKPWCSLGARLDAALVTAHVGAQRQLFRVDLRGGAVRAQPARGWVARGLRTVVSVPVAFDHAPARAVGAPQWYLERAGFAWGAIGVAACWQGAAEGVADSVRRAAVRRPGELSDLHVGAVETALTGSAAALDRAAVLVDGGDVADPDVLALRTRAVVADAVERVLREAGHALGPAPLAFDAEHAARVADLELYVRQHHAERDVAELGRRVLEPGAS